MVKKLLSILLIITIMISSISFGEIRKMDVNDFDFSKIELSGYYSSEKLSEDLQNVEKSEKVRVIIELSKEPIIKKAILQGVMLKDLSSSSIDILSNEILSEQKITLNSIESVVGKQVVHNRFTNVFNGFSMTVTAEEALAISNLDNVKKVYLANEYTRPISVPYMDNSSQITNSKFANEDLGFKGEGLVVAIIDTGIDPNHKDMFLDGNAVEGEMSKIEVDYAINQGLPGRYYTTKVPYGYNYMDKNDIIIDNSVGASMHGMHVAGTVAADGELTGVAPKSQVLAMKVFGNDPEFPSTFGDVIIAAIDDSIALGADVMNLSLGSTAAFVNKEDPEQIAITRAVNSGVIMSISAGNSAYYGNGHDLPLASNPDIGVVGSPGLVSESIEVASANNYNSLYVTKIDSDLLNESIFGYGQDTSAGQVKLVAIGGDKLGFQNNYDGIDVTGKYVLVSRGAIAFNDKIDTAKANGAIGIICYDHEAPGSSFYKNQGGRKIPFFMINKASGLILEKLLETNDNLDLNIMLEEEYIDPTSGQISSFSSWGTAPDMSFKPDITAPGGNIYSTLNDNAYGFMSGTSMSAPHVAGGSALVVERINEDLIFNVLGLSKKGKVDFAKNILMNTAKPIRGEYALTSPRSQGAGSMDLKAALTTTAIVVEPNTNLAKVNVGEISNKKIKFSLVIKNYGNLPLVYELEEEVFMQITVENRNMLITNNLSDVNTNVSIEGPFRLKGNETKTISFEFDLKDAKPVDIKSNIIDGSDPLTAVFTNGNFVEAFVFFRQSDAFMKNAGIVYEEAISSKNKSDKEIENINKRFEELNSEAIKIEENINLNKENTNLNKANQDIVIKEINNYKLANLDSIKDYEELLLNLDNAHKNYNNALEGFSNTKEALLNNAEAYSTVALLQGNYDFIMKLYDFIDNNIVIKGLKGKLKLLEDFSDNIVEITSVLSEYKSLIETFGIDDSFLTLTTDQQNELLSPFVKKIELLNKDLNKTNVKLIDIKIWIESFNEKLIKSEENLVNTIEKIENNTTKLDDLIKELEEKKNDIDDADTDDSDADDSDAATDDSDLSAIQLKIDKLKEIISKLNIKKIKLEEEITKYKETIEYIELFIILQEDIMKVLELNNSLLGLEKEIQRKVIIVNNSLESLKLIESVNEGTDWTVYNTYKDGLNVKEEKLNVLETDMVNLNSKLEENETLLDVLNTEKLENTSKLKEFTNLIESLNNTIITAKENLDLEEIIYDKTVELSVPVIGFYGNWNDAPAFDAPRHSENSFYNISGLLEVIENEFFYMSKVSAISPNDDDIKDEVIPYVTALRNINDFKIEVLNEEKEVIRVLVKSSGMRKHYFDNNNKNPRATIFEDGAFDGKVNLKLLDDGKYYIRYSGNLSDGYNSKLDIPLLIDTEKPQYKTSAYNFNEKVFSIRATDELSGIENIQLVELHLVDGELVKKGVIANDLKGNFDFNELDINPDFWIAIIVDFAGNSNVVEKVFTQNDGLVPDIKLNVEAFAVTTKRAFKLVGTGTDMLSGVTVMVDGESVQVNERLDGTFSFEKEMIYDSDGKKFIDIEATDVLGNQLTFKRWFYIDSLVAKYELSDNGENNFDKEYINYLEYGTEIINGNLFVEDNFPYLNVKVNGSVVYNEEYDFISYEEFIGNGISKNIDTKIELTSGLNELLVEVDDASKVKVSSLYRFYVLNEVEKQPESSELKLFGDEKFAIEYSKDAELEIEVFSIDQYGFKVKEENREYNWNISNDKLSISETGIISIPANTLEKTEVVIVTVSSQGLEDVTKEIELVVEPFLEDVKLIPETNTFLNKENDVQFIELNKNEEKTVQFDVILKDQYKNNFLSEITLNVEGDNLLIGNDGLLSIGKNAVSKFKIIVKVNGEKFVFEYKINRTEGSTLPNTSPIVPQPKVNTGSSNTSSAKIVPQISVKLNKTKIELEYGTDAVNTFFNFVATVTGSDSKKVNWTTTDETIIKVDKNGLVTGISAGIAKVIAMRVDGIQKAEATIEVFLVGEEISPLGAVEFNKPYMNGFPDGTFRPYESLTRGQLSVIYSNILGLNLDVATKQIYTDVDNKHWAFKYIQAVSQTGIFSGYEDNTFKPNQILTRAELAATFSNFWEFRNIKVDSMEIKEITDISGHWALNAINKLYSAKVLNLADDKKFNPDANATRADAVLMINKLIGRKNISIKKSSFSDVDDLNLMGAIEGATTTTFDK